MLGLNKSHQILQDNYIFLIYLEDDDTDKKTITLNSLTNISPSILSDLYFWLSLKKENSSILAANVYDIRKGSFDIEAYLEAAQSIN